MISIIGEPGIGKSRLVGEFERRFCADAVVLHGRCLPYGEALGYWALTSMIKEAASIVPSDDTATVKRRLTELVATALLPEEAAEQAAESTRRLALLTGLNAGEPTEATNVDQRTLHNSVRRFLEGLARRKPLCLMFEDIQWADAALLDLIEFVASRAKEAPLLILTQARPGLLDKRSNWGGGVRAFTSLPLEPLSDASGRELIEALCREKGLPESSI